MPGTLERLQQDVGHFTVERLVRPSREPLLDLLEQPNVAVGIAERGIRGIGTALGIWARSARVGPRVKAATEAAADVVEHLAYLDAVREELAAGRVDVVHRQDQAVDRARLGGSDPLAEDDRRLRTGRGELYPVSRGSANALTVAANFPRRPVACGNSAPKPPNFFLESVSNRHDLLILSTARPM
jgi:hypothetical protein